MAPITRSITLQNRLTVFFGVSFQIIGIVFLTRLINDTGIRIVYPFIPQFSTGLGLTIVGFSWLIFVRTIVGVTGPLFGLLADRYGRRKIMAAGLLCQCIATAGVALSWQWWAIAPMILSGMGLAAFIPAEQAYISDQAASEKRGRALGAVELSWAITGIISLPIIGWMIDAFGWRSPFLVLSLFSLIGASLAWFLLPAAEHKSHTSLTRAQAWKVCLRPNVLASTGVAMFLFAAVGSFITVWGIWLSTDFDLNAIALGFVATAIAIAELGGAGLSSLFIDRIGKRRGSQAGLLLTAVAFLLIPFSQVALWAAILALVLLGFFIEFAIVSLIPLYAEQAPEARATVFSLTAFGVSIGAAIGSPITAIVWEQFGLWVVCIVAAGCVLIALSLVSRFLRVW